MFFFSRHEKATLGAYALRLFLAASFVAGLIWIGRGGLGR